jgi:hypothetical protein
MKWTCAFFKTHMPWLGLTFLLGISALAVNSSAQSCTASGTEVKVCLPATGATVNNPVHFIAAASTTCSKGISSMGIYSSSGDQVFLVSAATIDTFLPLAPASYTATVQEWDNCGGSTSSKVSITVQSNAVLMYQYNAYHTAANVYETTLTTANVNSSTFGKLFTCNVDGLVQGQPLYVPNLTISGSTHNVVYVVTENNSIYAFDADGSDGCDQLWHDRIDVPVSGAGILSTPFIVPDQGPHGAIYVEGKTCPGGSSSGCPNGYWHGIHEYDLTTGAALASTVISGESVSGSGYDNVDGVITFNDQLENQRPALLYAAGTIYAGFGSVNDTDPWHGWVMGFSASNLTQQYVFNTTPNYASGGTYDAGERGGIWGGALAADWGNYVYFSTGNGTFDNSVYDYGDSYVKLYLNGSSLAVADYFTPDSQQLFSDDDLDVASAGATLLPNQSGSYPHEMVGAGKCGVIYVIDRDDMGEYNASTDQIIQELGTCTSGVDDPAVGNSSNSGDVNNYSSPAYWNENVYFVGVNDYAKAFSVTNGLLSTSATSKSAITFPTFGANPSVSANGTTNGIVWIVQFAGSGSGTLYAYEATNLADELYNSSQAGSRDTLGSPVHFAPPTIVNGKVYVGTQTQLVVYGLL